jgi:hypothetical protein
VQRGACLVAEVDDPEVWHPPFFAPAFWTDGWVVWGIIGKQGQKADHASRIHGATGCLTRYQGYGNHQFHPKNTKRDFSGTTMKWSLKWSHRPKTDFSGTTTSPIVMQPVETFVPTLLRVIIVMATYNGSRFIEEQIQSILAQSYANWVLYVRDDGSCDDTVQKIMKFERNDPRIQMVRDELGNQGAIGNFSILMEFALKKNAGYVFFADQDDIWNREKITTLLAGMQKLELTYSAQTPLLVHCDLTVVNEVLQVISNSFVKFSRLSPTTSDLGVLLCQNQVTGCACAINRALLELACPVPHNVLMHDWWTALLASSVGKIGFIPKSLVNYRQHGGNVLGAISFGHRIKRLLFSSLQWKRSMEVIKRGFVQAEMLKERIGSRGIELSSVAMKQINTYSSILNTCPFIRAGELRSHNIGRSGNTTGLVFYLLITVMKRK